MLKTIMRLKQLKRELMYRYHCLQEVWQPGYGFDYRWFRLKEAFWLNSEEE